MNNDELTHWLNAEWVKADEAKLDLRGHLKSVNRTISDRIRIAEGYKSKLREQMKNQGQAEMFPADTLRSPEVDRLLRSPLSGL